jgi:hypothetical protein
MLGSGPKTGRSFEEDGRASLEELQRRGRAYELEGEAERDPETGERPGLADRARGSLDHLASHLPHPKG